jgi:hypothetical protein
MLPLDDLRWTNMKGGHRRPFDHRPLLLRLETENETNDVTPIWRELREELLHQGSVDEASYAAVPHMVRIYRRRGILGANVYTLVAAIEVARAKGGNPEVPGFLSEDYVAAIMELADTGLRELAETKKEEEIFGILALITLWKGYKTWGYALMNFQEQELAEILDKGMQEYLTLLHHTLSKL